MRLLIGVKDELLRTEEESRADSWEERPLRFSVALRRRNNYDVYLTGVRLSKSITESRGTAYKVPVLKALPAPCSQACTVGPFDNAHAFAVPMSGSSRPIPPPQMPACDPDFRVPVDPRCEACSGKKTIGDPRGVSLRKEQVSCCWKTGFT